MPWSVTVVCDDRSIGWRYKVPHTFCWINEKGNGMCPPKQPKILKVSIEQPNELVFRGTRWSLGKGIPRDIIFLCKTSDRVTAERWAVVMETITLPILIFIEIQKSFCSMLCLSILLQKEIWDLSWVTERLCCHIFFCVTFL